MSVEQPSKQHLMSKILLLKNKERSKEMNKTYMITFSISVLVLVTVVIIALMILLPQQSTLVDANINDYDAIKKSSYTFEQTKGISKEALVREYTINGDQMSGFKSKNQYAPGNADPFTPNAGGSSSGEGNGSSNGSSSSGNSSQDANDKTTNSNGGTPNPPATSK